MCGAFYTLKYLSNKNIIHNLAEFERDFIDKAGSLKCSEIKAFKKFSCLDCVTKCAHFLKEFDH